MRLLTRMRVLTDLRSSATVRYEKGVTRVALKSGQMELDMIVSFKKNIKSDEAVDLAQLQMQEIVRRAGDLSKLFRQMEEVLPSDNLPQLRQLLSKHRDLFTFDTTRRD